MSNRGEGGYATIILMKFRKTLLLLGIIAVVSLAVWKIWQIREFRGFGEIREKQKENFSYAKVKQVIDGDTIKLESGETVRYIGMDAPEVWELDDKNKWYKVYKCYSGEAMRKNQELAEGKVVRLEKDISEKDKYDRLLRYVFACEEPFLEKRGQGEFCNQFINLELAAGGFAKTMTVPPDRKYEQQILAAEKEARENKRGLWGICGQ